MPCRPLVPYRSTISAVAALLLATTAEARAAFALDAFFKGRTFGRGVVDTLGSPPRAFVNSFDGTVSKGRITLVERLRFADGSRPEQVWRLVQVAPTRYEGTITVAAGSGPVVVETRPDGADIVYRGPSPTGGGSRLTFRHSMRLQPDGTLVNRVRVSAGFLKVGSFRVRLAKRPLVVAP